jgi:type IV pilus assembly protein PilQ
LFNPEGKILPKYTGAPVIQYSINYLIQNGKGRVLANPRILITSGKKSSIKITSSYIKKVTSQVMDSVASLSGAVQKQYDIAEDLGIDVELQPYISPDGYVTINIIPTYSTIKEQITEPRTLVTNEALGTTQVVNDLVATLIDKRELNLQNIRIKDGETMVIGGMLKETETKRINKFPILGDIPLIGALFRSSTSQKEKNELVIMLTPRIVKDSVEVVNDEKVKL